ncbi:MAG: ABC transporter permease, partial [Firmicutes bacterium]|nr:ABC transporter permease [Bacillota bacterium]
MQIRQWQRDGTLWLIVLYLLISILIVSANYYQIKQQEMGILTRGLYDPTSFTFTLQDSSRSIDWRQLDTNKPFTIFNELDTKEQYADRAIYFKDETFVPPMVSGRYFTSSDFYNGEQVAVLGQEVGKRVGKEDVFQKGGKEYFRLAGKTFEVIGRMGASYPSEVDELALVNMDAIDRFPNLYVMNTEDNRFQQDQAL